MVVRAKAKDSSKIVVSGSSASIQTIFTPPLYLNGRDYEFAMVNLETYYGVGRHAGEQLVNIMSVNSILVHCNTHS